MSSRACARDMLFNNPGVQMKEATKVFVMVPNYWAFQGSLEEGFKWLSRESDRSVKELRAGTHFALEFPADAKVAVDEVSGHWHSSRKALRLVSQKNMETETLRNLERQTTKK